MLMLKYLLLLCFFHKLKCQNVRNQQNEDNTILWDSYAPGQLLHKLNQLTMHIDAAPMHLNTMAAAAATTTTRKPPSALSAKRRWDNVEAASDFNYDRAYEDFVRKYFTNAVANAYSAENSASIEEDVATEASRKQHRRQQCKRVRKNREICNICRNPKSGEKMETCSYSTETEPHEYSYERARNYKKTRNSEDASDEEADEHIEDDLEGEDSGDVYDKNQALKYGTCTLRRHHHKICYICINSSGEKITECNKLEGNKQMQVENNDERDSKNEKKLRKSQRISKRTVSYSFEHNNTTNLAHPSDKQNSTVEEYPTIENRVFVKVLKSKEVLP